MREKRKVGGGGDKIKFSSRIFHRERFSYSSILCALLARHTAVHNKRVGGRNSRLFSASMLLYLLTYVFPPFPASQQSPPTPYHHPNVFLAVSMLLLLAPILLLLLYCSPIFDGIYHFPVRRPISSCSNLYLTATLIVHIASTIVLSYYR